MTNHPSPYAAHPPASPAGSPLPPGYEPLTGHGPKVRTDVVDVYVIRAATASETMAPGRGRVDTALARENARSPIMLLQLLRAGEPMKDTWQPVMGHLEAGETAVEGALRELREEVGLVPTDLAFCGLWALEQVHPFYIAAIDTIVMSPRFVVEVAQGWFPTLNAEHTAMRWVHESQIDCSFLWPGQRSACRELLAVIADVNSPTREALRVRLKPDGRP